MVRLILEMLLRVSMSLKMRIILKTFWTILITELLLRRLSTRQRLSLASLFWKSKLPKRLRKPKKRLINRSKLPKKGLRKQLMKHRRKLKRPD